MEAQQAALMRILSDRCYCTARLQELGQPTDVDNSHQGVWRHHLMIGQPFEINESAWPCLPREGSLPVPPPLLILLSCTVQYVADACQGVRGETRHVRLPSLKHLSLGVKSMSSSWQTASIATLPSSMAAANLRTCRLAPHTLPCSF